MRNDALGAFLRMGKSKRIMAEFAKELLVTIFGMTVFVEAVRTTFWVKILSYSSWGTCFCEDLVEGVPYLKNNAVFGKFQYF